MNKNLKNKKFGRSSSFQKKFKRSVLREPRSKTPDKIHENILQNKSLRDSIQNVRSSSFFLPFKVVPDSDNKSVIFFADYDFLNKYLELSKGIYPPGFNLQVVQL
jgi:hypothetical protein